MVEVRLFGRSFYSSSHGCHPLRHPRMLLSGDLLIKPFKRSQTVWEIPDEYCVFSGMIGMKIVIPRMPPPPSSPHANPSVIPACQPLRHPRMLLSGDLLKRPFKRSQTVWEIPDEYCVFSGMIGMKIVIPRMPPPPSSPHANPSVIPACQPLRHPRMLLSGDLLKRLFERSQTVWEIPARRPG